MSGQTTSKRARNMIAAAAVIGLLLLAVTASATPQSFSGSLPEGGQSSFPLGTLYPGDQVKLSLTATNTVDFVCGVGVSAGAPVWSVGGTTYPKTLIYSAPAGDPIDASALARSVSGSGEFKLLAYLKNRTALGLSASPKTVSYGAVSTLKALLTAKGGTAGVANKSVKFYSSADGKSWTHFKSVSSATSTYATAVRPASKTYYRAVYPGTTGDEGFFSSTSANAVVTPKVYLSGPTVPSSMIANKTYTMSGYLKPRHTAGAKSVKIQAQVYSGGTWVTKKTVYATNYNYSTYTKYVARIALPYKGNWRLRAYAAADSRHATTATSWRSTRVPTQRAASVSAWVSDTTPVSGQTVYIYAKVKDAYGKPIPNATVTMTAYNNSVSRTRVCYTDSTGVAVWDWCP